MRRLLFAPLLISLFFFTASVTAQTVLWDSNRYEEYQPGNAPIIIVAPHGGNKNPGNRTCGDTNSGIDSGSQETARLVTDKIQQLTGRRPHLIVNHLDRSRLDANRAKTEATCGDPVAGVAWNQFHAFINQAKNSVNSQYGKGHYFDLHSQISHGARSEIGILLTASQLTSNNIKTNSSLKSLAAKFTDAVPLISGQHSLGGMLSARGFRSVPSPIEPRPAGAYYNGAYNTEVHGSWRGGTIDATQIEGYSRFQDPGQRDAYATALAESIACYIQIHYQINLNINTRTLCNYNDPLPTSPSLTPSTVQQPTVVQNTNPPLQSPTPAGPRYVDCDLCGYCPPKKIPSTWESCRKCIYPSASGNPTSKSTLLINPTTNSAPTPHPGRQYTEIGCVATNVAGFSQEGGAAKVVQTLLNLIFGVIGGIAFLYLLYGGFIILTSQAEPEKLSYGKRLIFGAVTGLIFSLLSAFIINFLAKGVLGIPGF